MLWNMVLKKISKVAWLLCSQSFVCCDGELKLYPALNWHPVQFSKNCDDRQTLFTWSLNDRGIGTWGIVFLDLRSDVLLDQQLAKRRSTHWVCTAGIPTGLHSRWSLIFHPNRFSCPCLTVTWQGVIDNDTEILDSVIIWLWRPRVEQPRFLLHAYVLLKCQARWLPLCLDWVTDHWDPTNGELSENSQLRSESLSGPLCGLGQVHGQCHIQLRVVRVLYVAHGECVDDLSRWRHV